MVIILISDYNGGKLYQRKFDDGRREFRVQPYSSRGMVEEVTALLTQSQMLGTLLSRGESHRIKEWGSVSCKGGGAWINVSQPKRQKARTVSPCLRVVQLDWIFYNLIS